MIITGLDFKTDSETLFSYFSRFGEVVHSKAMFEQDTIHCKGYGYITYAKPASVNIVLNSGMKTQCCSRQADSSILPALHSWSSRRSCRAARKDIVASPKLKSNFQHSNFQ